ncbi:MAG: hypothetical protein KAT29_10755 [Anaerolineales bacterium]|nr:hypothetical protein [Anaerolineales bacterium]
MANINNNLTERTAIPAQKLSRRFWLALMLLGFAGQLAWGVENQFFNTFVYNNIRLLKKWL